MAGPKELASSGTQAQQPKLELSRWRLLEDFQARLAQSTRAHPLLPTWHDPQRGFSCGDYLSLFLFGLLNPVVVRTMRGLCAASHRPRVQQEICTRPIRLGSFSEAEAVVEPKLLADVLRPAQSGSGRWRRLGATR